MQGRKPGGQGGESQPDIYVTLQGLFPLVRMLNTLTIKKPRFLIYPVTWTGKNINKSKKFNIKDPRKNRNL